MIRHRISPALILALVVVTLIPSCQSARACGCPLIEPDAAYDQAFLIFTGKVDKVTELTREIVHDGKTVQSSNGRITHLTVEEYFKGGGGPEVELRGGNTSCDIHFEAGKRYIVYASQDTQTGSIGAFSCSRTQPFSDYTKPDLSYLQRVKRGERPTMLYGFALKNTADTAKRRGESDPLGDLMVIVEGEGKRLELKTDATGYFESYDLSPGSYRVRTGVTGKLRGAEEKTVEIKSGSVTSMAFHTTTMGSLSGRVIDQEGHPVGEIIVALVFPGSSPTARPITYQTTDEDGKFNFNDVLADRYVLAVNPRGGRSLYGSPFLPSYYPNVAMSVDAKVITVTDGVVVELDDFVLQKRYPTVAVSGTVVTSDGKPIQNAYVYLDQSGGGWDTARGAAHTDAEGRFVHQAYEGVTYSLHASADGPTGVAMESDRVEVVAGKTAAAVRIVIKRPK